MRNRELFPLLALLAGIPAAWAQQFGQWQWFGKVQVGGRELSNQQAQRTVSEFGERTLGAELGLQGFVVHPAIARFTLGLDASKLRYRQSVASHQTRLGFRLNAQLLPESVNPIELFAGRRWYQYAASDELSPLAYLATPESTTFGGARLRLRRGALAGLLLGLEATRTSFVEQRRPQEDTRGFLDWSGSGKKLQHHFRLERQEHRFAVVDYRWQDLTANYEQHGNLAPELRWDLAAQALQRSFAYRGNATSFQLASLDQSLVRQAPSGASQTLGYRGSFLAGEDAKRFTTHDLAFAQHLAPRGGFRLGFEAGLGWQEAQGSHLAAPRVGVSGSWERSFSVFRVLLTGAVAEGRLEGSQGGARFAQRYTASSAGVSLGAGEVQRLRVELEAGSARNQLRQAADLASSYPGGQLPEWLGTSDARHARVRLTHQQAGFSVTAFSDWQRLSQGRLLQATPVTGTTRTHTMQIASGPLQLVGNVGSSRWQDGTDVALDFASVAGSVRFGRNVSFRGSHRIEKRHVPFQPQLDFTRSEASLDFSLGAFVASIVGETVSEQLEGGVQRRFKSLRWTISRGFGGLLPFVSAPARRGVIR